ncbi:MAG: GxxExxY protein [Anaerolineae bacterium]
MNFLSDEERYQLRAQHKKERDRRICDRTYLKLSDCRVGLLINFNVKMLKEGIQRIRR